MVFIWNIQGKIRENEHICPLTVYIKKKLNRRFYKLVTVTWNPNHKLKYNYIQWNETEPKKKPPQKYNRSEQSQ